MSDFLVSGAAHGPWPDDESMPNPMANEVLTFAELAALPDPVMLNEYLSLDSIAWIGGNPGAYKSFMAVQWACDAAAAGHTVVYVVAEGVTRFSVRFKAWAECNGRDVPEGLLFLPRSVQANTRDWDLLRDYCADKKPSLIVLDTQARMTVGLSENDSKDMGMYVNAVDRLRTATHACVLSVHHSPKAYASLRGSSALIGAADCIVMANRPDPTKTVISLTNYKQKDIEQLPERWMRTVSWKDSITLQECEKPEWWAEAVKASVRA